MRERGSRAGQVIWVLLVGFCLAVPLSIAAAEGLAVLAMLVWVGERIARGRASASGQPSASGRWERTPLDLPILCFVAAALASVFWGADTARSLKGAGTYGLILIIYLVTSQVRDPGRLRWLVLAMIAGMSIGSVMKICEVASVAREVERTAGTSEMFWNAVTAKGSMSQAGQLLVAIGLGVALAMNEKRRGWLLALGAALAVMLVAEMLNFKRGSWAGLVCIVGVAGWLRMKKLVLVAAAAAVTVLLFYEPAWNRVVTLREEFSVDKGGRLAMWKTVPAIMKDYPLGVGIDNVGLMRKYDPGIEEDRDHMHNTYVQLLVETGPLGLAAFLWWMIVFVRAAGGMLRRSRACGGITDAVAVAAVSVMAGFLVNGLVEFNFGDSEVVMMIYFLMGATLVVRRHLCGPRAPTGPESASRAKEPLPVAS